MSKNYQFGLKRTNKNGSKIWHCTHKSCNASITKFDCSIVKTSSIKSDGNHEYQQPPNEKVLIQVKQEYLDGLLDLTGYQKRIRSFCYRDIKVFASAEKDDIDL
jgi:hypothetical protein